MRARSLRDADPYAYGMIVLAGGLYLLRAPFYWVGTINDDACYITLAQFGLAIFLFGGVRAFDRLHEVAADSFTFDIGRDFVFLCDPCDMGDDRQPLSSVILYARRSVNNPGHGCPVQTWQWINNSLPKPALLMSASDSQTYLYTHRIGVPFFASRDAEEYRYLMMQQGITHVLTRPYEIAQSPGINIQEIRQLDEHWVSSNPQFYHLLFQNSGEVTAIYDILPSTSFVNAYTIYLWSKNQLNEGHMDSGLVGLNQALNVYPSLVSALNAYGAACYLSGRHLEKAKSRLRQAVLADPSYALGWVNLSRVCRTLGDNACVDDALSHARTALAAPEWTYLRAALDPEVQKL